MTVRPPRHVAVPSKGRLRDDVIDLLATAGFQVGGLRGRGSIVDTDQLILIEMRPRDAAAALAAAAIDGAFISTDIAIEAGVDHYTRVPLGTSRSTLVLAAREDSKIRHVTDLEDRVVATHMPVITERFLADAGVEAHVLTMGGSLEGLCAAGLADAIVDNTETGTSLLQNSLTVVDSIEECQAELVYSGPDTVLDDLQLRVVAAREARQHRYVMLHLDPARVDGLTEIFSGLASPTLLPLAGRDDLVAVHLVVPAKDFWDRLGQLRDLGATGIVAMRPDALAP